MKIMHTSDWHLGQTLIDVRRDEEHRAFITWLLQKIGEEKIEAVIIAGDIFDIGVPGNQTLEVYYSFLASAAETGCRQVIVVGGNHDSPATLHAPRAVLSRMNVTVIGAVDTDAPDQTLVPLKAADGTIQAIVCAVPYLRDRDVYQPKPGELDDARAKGIIDGIAQWYQKAAERAENLRQSAGVPTAPIIATGHLFARGGSTSEHERPIYIGNLGAFPADRFPAVFDYVALGHLHRPQLVEGRANIRYSGSPVPLAFDEAKHAKQVLIIDTANPREPQVLEVPLFRKLLTISGDITEIEQKLQEIGSQVQPSEMHPLVFVFYIGNELLPDLSERVAVMAEGRPMRCFSKNMSLSRPVETSLTFEEIKALSPKKVFERRLEGTTLSPEDHEQVLRAFDEIVETLTRGEPS